MIKILLACSAGMSTSILEKSMSEHAKKIGMDVLVEAKASNYAKETIGDYDIVLLGPQVTFMLASFKQIAGDIPVILIPPQTYALAKGDECMKLVLDNLKK